MQASPIYKPGIISRLFCRFGLTFSSTLGLLFLLIVFTVCGALLFQFVEQPNERIIHFNLNKEKNEFLNSARKWIKNDKEYQQFVKRFENYRLSLLEGFSNGVTDDGDTQSKWTFWSSVFYCLTVYTTIGYGNIFPTTDTGRILTICYSLIGIPLCLIVLNQLGKLFTRILRTAFVYPRYRFAKPDLHAKVKVPHTLREVYNSRSDAFDFSVTAAILITSLYMLVGILLYRNWEDWSYINSLYFIFISLSTIGFGDVLPDKPVFFLFSSLYIFVGLALVSMLITVIQENIEAALANHQRYYEEINKSQGPERTKTQ